MTLARILSSGAGVTCLRAMLRSRRPAIFWLAALVLAVRALVPQGFMIMPGSLFALMPCPQAGAAAVPTVHHMAAPAHGMSAVHDPAGAHHESSAPGDGVCAFAPLGHAAAAGADPLLPVAAIAFLLVLGVTARPAPVPPRPAFLTPPLRGPPLTA